MGRRLTDAIWQRIRAGYYAFDFVRALPFAERLGKAVHAWETRQGYGDSPRSKNGWDDQFSRGQWDYMRKEELRYEAVVDCIRRFAQGGSLLDVGCGEGILHQHILAGNVSYQRYVGMDISEVAIGRLANRSDSRNEFRQGDGDTFEPEGFFDIIVFNESLYYLKEPLEALDRYSAALVPGGVFLISTYTSSRRALAILRDVKRHRSVLHEKETFHGDLSWLCTVLRGPADAGDGRRGYGVRAPHVV